MNLQANTARLSDLWKGLYELACFLVYLTHEVIVDAVFEGAEDDDGPRELEVDLLHGLVRQYRRRQRGGRRTTVLASSPVT